MRKLNIFEYKIPLKRAFVTAAGQLQYRQGLILKAECDDSRIGLGEAAPYPGLSRETVSDVVEAALELEKALVGTKLPIDLDALRVVIEQMESTVSLPPSLRFAVETLLADLSAQGQGITMARWLNSSAASQVPVNALLAGDEADLETQVGAALVRGLITFKVKVGSRSESNDLPMVRKLRNLLGAAGRIRLDANRAYSFDDALSFLNEVERFDIEYVEEPLKSSELNRLPELKKSVGVRIALDETVMERDRFLELISTDVVDVVVLKPTVLGGFSRCLDIAKLAATNDVKLVITSAMEAGIGVTACLHLAAAVGDNVLPCGLTTLELLSDSLVSEIPTVRDGRVALSQNPGLAVTLTQPHVGTLREIER